MAVHVVSPHMGRQRSPRPWIIWVENVRNRAWFLMVLSPKVGWLSRRVRVHTAYSLGPVFYKSPDREMEIVDQLIEAGKEVLPSNIPYRVSMSLSDTKEILKDSWGT